MKGNKKMKVKMWCLVNKKTGKVIKTGLQDKYSTEILWVIGFNTKKDILKAIGGLEHGEEIWKIEIEI